VNTKFNKDLIIQETGFSGSDRNSDMARNVIQLQEQGVREALIKLGWTPQEGSADLQAQNDELRAKLHNLQVEILDMSCAKENNSGFEPSLSVYQRSIDIVIAEARKTPTQALADIRAEAVIEAANAVVRHNEYGFCLHCLLIDHANKIKGAE